MPEKAQKPSDAAEPMPDATPVDVAPKRRGRPKGSTNRGANSSTIKAGLTSYVGTVGTMLMMFPKTYNDGVVILQGADALTDSLVELAKQDKRVRNVLTTMCTGGAWGAVIIASAQIGIPIAANHGLLPKYILDMFGTPQVPSPEPDTAEESEPMREGVV